MYNSENIHNCHKCNHQCFVHYFDEHSLDVLDQNKTCVEYSPGQVITKESSFNTQIIFIREGFVKIVKEGKGHKNSVIKILGKDNFLTVPLHENQKRFSYTAIAISDVTICEIQENVIHNSIYKSQKFMDYLMDKYYEDHLFMLNKIHLISTKNNHGKLAASIIYLNTFNNPNFSIFDYISRKDLAELSSISLESVNKILQELNNDKIISIQKKGLTISKMVLLEKLSQLG